jgi:hypothetical protein
MNIVARVQSIILKPKEEWVKIKAEPSTVAELFTSYAMILAAIPALAQFIGLSIIGQRVPFIGMFRWGIGKALPYALVSYVFSLGAVYVFGFIINVLAPNFSSAQNIPNAMKLAVYSMTPLWLAGILYIIPALGILAIIGSLYGLYVLYLGFDMPMMDTPKDKVMGYMIVCFVVVIVLILIFSWIPGVIFAVRYGRL